MFFFNCKLCAYLRVLKITTLISKVSELIFKLDIYNISSYSINEESIGIHQNVKINKFIDKKSIL